KEALRQEFQADATEMEGAAVVQVCGQLGVPCLVLRSLSDDAGAKAKDDVRLFEKTAAQNAARLVAAIVARLEAKRAAPPAPRRAMPRPRPKRSRRPGPLAREGRTGRADGGQPDRGLDPRVLFTAAPAGVTPTAGAAA